MNYYSYLVEHDFGLAPNPFGNYCTLTVCKPKIRKSKNLRVGDWIIGTGSKALENTSGRKLRFHVIYAMQVSEIIPMENYWNDDRFKKKRPILNGSLSLMYGDNFYHKNNDGIWVQEDSAHSNDGGTQNLEHLRIDVSGKNAVISKNFFYFGDQAPLLPERLHKICHVGVGEKLLVQEDGVDFILWLTSQFKLGVYGRPINWIVYNQQRFF